MKACRPEERWRYRSVAFNPSATDDLYRIENGKIAEHWDTLEAIPPREAWKNPNGKF